MGQPKNEFNRGFEHQNSSLDFEPASYNHDIGSNIPEEEMAKKNGEKTLQSQKCFMETKMNKKFVNELFKTKALKKGAKPMDDSEKRAFKCHHCGKEFARLNRYRAHMHSHNGTHPFVCPVLSCSKAFSEKQNLKTHMLIHTDDRPFPCPQGCGLSFRTKGNMMDHVRRHFNIR